jgi:FHA domain
VRDKRFDPGVGSVTLSLTEPHVLLGGSVPLKVIHQGVENVVEDDVTALIGSDASSTIRIVRPGISRRHAVISHDGSGWKVEDAGSRNGTFLDGKRVQVAAVGGPTTVYLGHPSDGEAISLVPVAEPPTSPATDEPEEFDLPPVAPTEAVASAATVVTTSDVASSRARRSGAATPVPRTDQIPTQVPQSRGVAASDVEVAQLTAAVRDQISAIKGLTWSIWAMIAVTAALIVLTLFVGILSN